MTGVGQRGLRVDVITLHWYGSDFGPAAVGQLRSYVSHVYSRYHKPVWLTEFALIKFASGGSTYPSAAQQVSFIRGATAMLNGLSYVERYAWFALPTGDHGDATGLYRTGATPTPRPPWASPTAPPDADAPAAGGPRPETGCRGAYGGAVVTLRPVRTDADYEAWRAVRTAVLPHERAPSVAELRGLEHPGRLVLLAERDGVVVGSGVSDRSGLAGRAMVAPRVVVAHRRRGIGTLLLQALATHAAGQGHGFAVAGIDDEADLGFAHRHGFTERDREVEQVRSIGAEPRPDVRPEFDVVTVAQRPELWPAAYHQVGLAAIADMATRSPQQVTPQQWERDWISTPEATFVALAGEEIIGLASLILDPDRSDRAEQGFTAVRRDWRGRGVATTLKRTTLWWAAGHGIAEVYTWTQQGNDGMRTVNEKLGFAYGHVSIRVEADLPLAAVTG